MATSVKIATPMPSTEQVARRLGISGERKRTILKLAEDAVNSYYQRSKSDSRSTAAVAKRAKAA
ncbi:MAG TPA: hypothetical protein VIJ79_12135 [Acidobacteriaceae bacterium]